MIVHGADSSSILRTLLLDSSGRPLIVASGADSGGVVRTIRTDTLGRPDTMINGIDPGGVVRTALTDTAGRLYAHLYSGGAVENFRTYGNYTTSYSSGIRTNAGWRGLLFMINVVTAPGGGQNLTPYVRAVDGTGSAGVFLTGAAAIVAPQVNAYVVYPGASTNVGTVSNAAPYPLTPYFDYGIIHSGAGIWNYFASVSLIE